MFDLLELGFRQREQLFLDLLKGGREFFQVSIVGLFFLSKRKHNRVKRIELVVEVSLYDLCLATLSPGLVDHDLLRLVLHNGILSFVGSGSGSSILWLCYWLINRQGKCCGLIHRKKRRCGLIHRQRRSRRRFSWFIASAIASANTQMSKCIHWIFFGCHFSHQLLMLLLR